MEKTELVFLCGLSYSGKDTVGKEFIKKGYIRVAFGDAVKEEYARIHNIDVKDLHIQGPIKELHRSEIINLAELQRAIDPTFWINKAIEPYLDENGKIKEGLKLVFTDVRRRSEIDFIYFFKSANSDYYITSKLFLIKNPNIIDPDTLSHNSIGYLEGINKVSPYKIIDAIVLNDGTKEELTEKVNRLIETFSL